MKEYRVTVETAITVMADSFESANEYAKHIVRSAIGEEMEKTPADVIDVYDAVVYDCEYVDVSDCVMVK